MHRGSIKCVDKQVPTIFYHLFHQSYSLNTRNSTIKRHAPLLILQNHFTNILNNYIEKQNIWDPHADIKKFLKDNACGIYPAIKSIMNIFKIDRNAAKAIIAKDIRFTQISKKAIVENYDILKSTGISTPLIQKNVLLLAEDSNELRSKINKIQKIVKNINYGLPLLHQDAQNIELFIKSNGKRKGESAINIKMKDIRQQLQIRPEEFYSIISKYFHHFIYNPQETVQKLKLLLDSGVSVNSLIENEWPMQYSYVKMKDTLTKYSLMNLSTIKPTIFFYNQKVLNRKIESKTNKTQLEEFIKILSAKSGYSEKVIKFKIMKGNFIRSTDVNQLKRKIEILLDEGYSYHDIIWSMKVMNLSEDIILDRLLKIKIANYKAPFLNILLMQDKYFVDYVNCK